MGRPATLDDIPETELDYLAQIGFQWIWLLSVWKTGEAGRLVSRTNDDWRRGFEEALPDLREDDIAGSGFAVADYSVSDGLGGSAALARVRDRLRRRGLRLMLDFVPNHMAMDHKWVETDPHYFMAGNDADLEREAMNYVRLKRRGGEMIFAHGRDPYFPGWPDTLQLDYSNPAAQEAMLGELAKIAAQCDGVRCDMAMLLLPDVFERTWGKPIEPFWPRAICKVRESNPDFCFMAEVYWDLESTLLMQGFDYAYDKRLYDRLRDGNAGPVRDHLRAPVDYQSKMTRFLENHDEPRAAATFSRDEHRAAATISYLSPGMRFFHQGQCEGKKVHISPHLIRGPVEPLDEQLKQFYNRLLKLLRLDEVHQGRWHLLECLPAWQDNWTWSCFVSFLWEGANNRRLLVAVNYASNQSQCYVRLPFADMADRDWQFSDQLSEATYRRAGSDLSSRGLYLDMTPWQTHAFAITSVEAPQCAALASE
ncbi:MAG TPA: alpha-amylase family glycosyl hydrolase [Candidatus Obscuribacterales bacterium]